MALVLSRNVGETVVITTPEGRRIVVRLVRRDHGKTSLAFECDREVVIERGELERAGGGASGTE